MTLEETKKNAIPVCQEFGVKRLDIFGSFARSEERVTSDLDFIVEFNDPYELDSLLSAEEYLSLIKK